MTFFAELWFCRSPDCGGVTGNEVLRGRRIGPVELAQAQSLLSLRPDWSRSRLSRELARRWAWRTASGQLQDMAARSLLLTLEQRGWISLPPCRWASPNRMRHKRRSSLVGTFHPEPVQAPLSALRPLGYSEVSAGPSAAAWQCAGRDRRMGWDCAARPALLDPTANKARCLILPQMPTDCYTSSILGCPSHVLRPVEAFGPVDGLAIAVEDDSCCFHAGRFGLNSRQNQARKCSGSIPPPARPAAP